MRLSEFLDRKRLTLDAFGAMVGVSGVSVHRWKTGKGVPSFRKLKKISEVTDGAVTQDDFESPAPADEAE